MTTARTQSEILERIEALQEEDFFGFHKEVLLAALSYENAKPYINEAVTQEQWENDYSTLGDEKVTEAALDYLAFALNKALNHRGLSASRSVEKMTEYAWLLGRDDVSAALEEAEYAPYGAPVLQAWATTYGPDAQIVIDRELVHDDGELARMLDGKQCTDDCTECFG